MSIVINGIGMPVNCTRCPCSDDETRFCRAANKYIPMLGKPEFCPLAEIIRCKDCKFWQDNNGGYPNMNCRWIDDETPDADDFCSYAERKGEQP